MCLFCFETYLNSEWKMAATMALLPILLHESEVTVSLDGGKCETGNSENCAKSSRGRPPNQKASKRAVWKPSVTESMEDFIDIIDSNR
jgi:hypothetical protein